MKKQRLLFIFFSVVLLLCWSAVLSLPKDSHAATISLPATGQTKCYNSSGAEIACAGTGQDGETRAGVTWPSPRFAVSGDCVTDNLTGLVWTKNANLPNGAKTWQQALDYVKSLNAGGGLCGQTDWRLPNVLELESLVHESFNNEICGASACSTNADWLNTQGFTNAQWYHGYWSSSTDAVFTHYAWFVDMYYGNVGSHYKSYDFHVWPVRGGQSGTASAEVWKTGQTKCYDTSGVEIACAGTGQDGDEQKGVAWPTPRFTDNSNGTITDNLTGLLWLKNANCFHTITWQDALTAANGLASGQCGLSDGSQALDWRLPSRKDLLSLVDYSNHDPALPASHPFTNAQTSFYWSSSTDASGTVFAWVVYMVYGHVGGSFKTSGSYVWPVRGGQSGSLCNLTISPSSQASTSAGGTGSVTVTATPSVCNSAWTATSALSWVTIPSGASGTGSGTVTISVSANTTGTARTGSIDIAGQTFTITQSGAAQINCVATLSSSDYMLNIPIVTFNGQSYSVDMEYVPSSDSLIWFKLTNAVSTQNTCSTPATLTSGAGTYKFHVPYLTYGSISYWADFVYVPTTDELIWFKLTNAGGN